MDNNSDTHYYDILGVNKDSSKDEIRNQYKKLAGKYHPDKKDGNEAKFQEITIAYEVLSDPDKRKIYDKYGEEGLNTQLYEQGEGQKRKCKTRVHFEHVSLEDIFQGSHLNITYTHKILCKGCDGTGTDNPAARRKCIVCQGAGIRISMQRVGFMNLQTSQECEECEGSGFEMNEFICEDCDGKAVMFEKKELKLDIEKGSPDGYRFTFIGQGDQKPRVENGDLVIELVLKKHPYFKREGADIWITIDLTLLEAISGFKKILPTLNGMERLSIETKPNEVIQHGEIRTILNKGLPFFNNPKKFGNMHVEFNVLFPPIIDEKKIIQVEKILGERYHRKISEEKQKEIYKLSDFNPDDVNTNVSGGKSDKETFKYSYNADEDEEDNYIQDDLHRGGNAYNCQHQ